MSVAKTSAQANLLATLDPHSTQSRHLHAVAVEVLHNLRHEHHWTVLCLHNISPITFSPLPRPLVSGLPPQRVYVHPDDQVHELKNGIEAKDIGVEREWVLPVRLKEKWTLRKFGNVFDAIQEEPRDKGDGVVRIWDEDKSPTLPGEGSNETNNGHKTKTGERRGGKRVLLATASDDSTVVYYVVHEGIVKPRQN
ncbi:uncharacterized protein KY384_001021 [Bacidia gigantensis]|uniref:uncharacterized protein n=1 Tax=Bacidia gigantensis TaxID=2732470 RepID=UPI001D045603|nr:uncharacterized protein KY384_001021 [Bacidia gigantensis]KAG8534177.1 hypothetical protein KY384_001021 [Bacidia gigantensis]